LDAEILLQSALELAIVRQCLVATARGGKDAEQLAVCPLAIGVEGQDASREADRITGGAARLGVVRQGLESADGDLAKPRALRREPFRKTRLPEGEAAQELVLVELDRRQQRAALARRDQRVELSDIAPARRPQPNEVAVGFQGFGTQQLSQRRQGMPKLWRACASKRSPHSKPMSLSRD
jgi:hypothetical protein